MRKALSFTLLCMVSAFAIIQETESTTSAADSPQTYDVVVYGSTSAGVSVAVQAKRMGKTAIIVGPDKHLGGLTAGGLGWTDSGRKEAIGGISREFYRRIKKHYDKAEACHKVAFVSCIDKYLASVCFAAEHGDRNDPRAVFHNTSCAFEPLAPV